MTDLRELGAAVEWTDAEAAAAARADAEPGAGRLAELAGWLAATQGHYPPGAPNRVRCLVVGPVGDQPAALAAGLEVGIRTVDGSSVDAGAAAADDEIESGAGLLVVAAAADVEVARVVVSLLTGAEPVALLPRGAGAVDSQAWITQARHLRDTRRALAGLRRDPDGLLAALDAPALAVAAGLVLRAVGRRTPVVLDGTVAVAAALLCYDVQSRAGRWWLVADTSADPAHTRATTQLSQRPVLDLGTSKGDGTAGLLALTVLRAAATREGITTS